MTPLLQFLVQFVEQDVGQHGRYTRNESLDIGVGNIAVREMLNPNYKALTAMFADPGKKIEAPKRRILSKGVGEGGWRSKWKEGY